MIAACKNQIRVTSKAAALQMKSVVVIHVTVQKNGILDTSFRELRSVG